MARLVLFDLDGTLVRSHNGFIPFNQAIEKTFGVSGDIRTVIPDASTDPVILEEIFTTANLNIKITEEKWRAFAENFHQSYTRTIEQGQTRIFSLPGVLQLVKELEDREGVYQGIVTGNLEVTGRLKLETAGLSPYLNLGASRERWERALGTFLPPDHCIIVGNTPKDLDAARQNQMKCLLVGTGRYPVQELELLGPDACVSDFTDTQASVKTLLSCPIAD